MGPKSKLIESVEKSTSETIKAKRGRKSKKELEIQIKKLQRIKKQGEQIKE